VPIVVLDHFEHEINEVLGGAERPDGTRVPVKIALLAGMYLSFEYLSPKTALSTVWFSGLRRDLSYIPCDRNLGSADSETLQVLISFKRCQRVCILPGPCPSIDGYLSDFQCLATPETSKSGLPTPISWKLY
jgi:hypothetical protein